MMSERQNTLCCIFDRRSPSITAYHIHEWIHDQMGLQEYAVSMIQIDGPRRRVYIKFVNTLKMTRILSATKGNLPYRHDNGEQSTVTIEIARLGTRDIRIATLTPEVPDRVLKEALNKYGEVLAIKEESWTTSYRYKFTNGVRLAKTKLKQRSTVAYSNCGTHV
jgi:hypothetical protein